MKKTAIIVLSIIISILFVSCKVYLNGDATSQTNNNDRVYDHGDADNAKLDEKETVLTTQTNNYNANTPVDLTSLSPYFEGYISTFINGEKDIMGNQYSSGIYGYMGVSDSTHFECYNIWYIGGEYDTLTATGIVFEEDKGSSYVASYKIYGDDVLLYEQKNIDSKTKPYQIKIDISGVTDLKIEMYGEGNVGADGMHSVLADIMLQKTKKD